MTWRPFGSVNCWNGMEGTADGSAARAATARRARRVVIAPPCNRGSALRLDPHPLGDDHDAALGHLEARLVLLGVVADDRSGGDVDVLVDDGTPDLAVASHRDVLEEDGALHVGVAVDPDPG